METKGGLPIELSGTCGKCNRIGKRVLKGTNICLSLGEKTPSYRSIEFVLYSLESSEKAKHVCWPFPQRKYSL